MVTLTQINVFPIKSMAGFSVSSAYVDKSGLAHDRQMMLVDNNGKFVTARKFPILLSFSCVLNDGGCVIYNQHGEHRFVKFEEFSRPVDVNIWRHDMQVVMAQDEINQWMSEQLGQDVKLVRVSRSSIRHIKHTRQQIAFADGYPLLIVGEASLVCLNDKAKEPSLMAQFRSNLIFSGAKGFIEDTWRRIKIGTVEFELVKPCERCVMTTVDMDNFTFRKSKEPLTALSLFRADHQGRLMFGENLIVLSHGVIKVGDSIEVLETHQGLCYSPLKN